jgi:hypothetical protein
MVVDEFQIKVFGDAGFADNDSIMTSGLGIGQVNSSYIAQFDNTSVGTVEEVHIIPKKKVTGTSNRIHCHEAKLKFTNVESC